MRAAVVVLNYAGETDTRACVESLAAMRHAPDDIIVVDNASPDGSGARLRASLTNATVLQSRANLGFAGGNNIGIRWALAHGADVVWLLNNDAIAAPSALDELLRAAEGDSAVGAWGTRIYHFNDRDKLQAFGGGWADPFTGRSSEYSQRVPARQLDYITGCSLLLRRDAMLSAGMLDEGFFMYFEDTDLGFRYRKQGWRLGVADDAVVWHKGGASANLSERQSAWRTQSLLRFQQLHGRPYVLAAATSSILRATSFALRRRWQQLHWLARDVRRFAREPDWRRQQP